MTAIPASNTSLLKLLRDSLIGSGERIALCPNSTLTRYMLEAGLFLSKDICVIADLKNDKGSHLLGIPCYEYEEVYKTAPTVILVCSISFSLEIIRKLSSLESLSGVRIVDLSPLLRTVIPALPSLTESANAEGNLAAIVEIERLKEKIRLTDPNRLELYGYRCYSQHEEDGIIDEILRRVKVSVPRIFIEFGVGDGLENNTLYLLKQGWRGLWIECEERNLNNIRLSYAELLRASQLTLYGQIVTVKNIDSLLKNWSQEQVGVLSIDIDGNDYHVWEAIDSVKPYLVVIEYNSKFPPPKRWTIAYDEGHSWDYTDYQGASLQLMCDLASRKGYLLVCCNLNGTNAFFLRSDLVNDDFPLVNEISTLYHPPRYYLTSGYMKMAGHSPSPRIGCWIE